jgi:lysyl-tRNA synthetase class 1
MWAERVEGIEWREEAIKDSMVALTSSGSLPVKTPEFFRALYLVLLGKERGPRAAPFLAVLERPFVLKRVLEATA